MFFTILTTISICTSLFQVCHLNQRCVFSFLSCHWTDDAATGSTLTVCRPPQHVQSVSGLYLWRKMKCVLGCNEAFPLGSVESERRKRSRAADDLLISWVYLLTTTAHRGGSWCSGLANEKQNQKLMTFMDFSSCCGMPSAWFIALNKYKEEGCRRDDRRVEERVGAAAASERELRWKERWGRRRRRGGVLNWEGGVSSRVVRLRSCLPSTEVYLKYLGTKWITVVYLQAADKQPGSFSGQSDVHQGLRASPLTWPAGRAPRGQQVEGSCQSSAERLLIVPLSARC